MSSDTTFSYELLKNLKYRKDNIVRNFLIENAEIVNMTNRCGRNLLHYAAKFGNNAITKYLLLDTRCNVDSEDCLGETALTLALRANRTAVLKTLLEADANVSTNISRDKSALHIACREHKLDSSILVQIFEKVRQKCSSTDDFAKKLIGAGCHLYQASYLDDYKLIEFMLRQGFLANDQSPKNKITPLHLAVAYSNISTVKLLIQNDAKVNVKDSAGRSALAYIHLHLDEKTKNKSKILKTLLKLGASPNACTPNGKFELHNSLIYGESSFINILLQSNLDFTATDDAHQRSVLHYLSMNRNPGVAEELRVHAKQFDVNALDADGTSPLYCAAKQGNLSMVAFLLDKGAHVNVEHETYGFTPLYNAYARVEGGLEKEYDQCVELLLQNYADPQFVAIDRNEEQITIFEAASATTSWNRLKPAIAQLAVLEKLGTPIKQLILNKISLYPPLFKYLNRCRGKIEETVTGNITLFELLTVNKRKMAKYLKNDKLVFELRRKISEERSSYTYYSHTLNKRYSEGVYYKMLQSNAADYIYNIFEGRLNRENLIIAKIIDFLDYENLKYLYLS